MGLSLKRESELRELAHKKYGWDRKQTDKAIGEALKYRQDFNPEKNASLAKKNAGDSELRFKRAEKERYENQVRKPRYRRYFT